MKKIYQILLGLSGVFFLFLCSSVQAQERILNYDVDIEVQEDASMIVNETITFFVEGKNIRLGIIRDIPQTYALYGKTIKTPITVNSVKRNNQDEPFWLESHNGVLSIFTGAKQDTPQNRLPFGTHTYTIAWQTKDHIRGFNHYDELYFNAVGTQWNFAIDKVTVRVRLPKSVQIKQAAAYIGKYNATEKNSYTQISDHELLFQSSRPLHKNEGFTIAAGFTKGVLTPASTISGYYSVINAIIEFAYPFLTFRTATILLILLITLSYYVLVWFLYGRDKLLPTVTPQFAPPAHLSPAKAAVLWHGSRYNAQSIFAISIVNLAAQGFLKIGPDYIHRTKKTDTPVFSEEKKLLDTLFTTGASQVKTDKYHERIALAFNEFKKFLRSTYKTAIISNTKYLIIAILLQLSLFFCLPGLSANILLAFCSALCLIWFYQFLLFNVVFNQNIQKIRHKIFPFLFIVAHGSAFILFLPLILLNDDASFSPDYFVFLPSVLLCFIMHKQFAYLLKQPTAETIPILNQLQGLKMFLSATDTERYRLITPSVFEKNLPFAMIFGVEKHWINQFKVIQPDYTPAWHSGQSAFNNRTLYMLNQSITQSAYQPSSGSGSSSSGSGFSSSGSSGGGSSGGGSGGGGGRGR